MTKATDFILTNPRDGSITQAERSAAIEAAQAALDAGKSVREAEHAACNAAFERWAHIPESAELVVE